MPCLPPLLAMPVLPDVLIHPHLEPSEEDNAEVDEEGISAISVFLLVFTIWKLVISDEELEEESSVGALPDKTPLSFWMILFLCGEFSKKIQRTMMMRKPSTVARDMRTRDSMLGTLEL